MIEINFFNSLYHIITSISEQLNEETFESNHESVIKLQHSGDGAIYQVSLKHSSLLTFDCTLKKELSITFSGTGKNKIYFIFCLRGRFQHTSHGKTQWLSAFKSITDCAPAKDEHTLTIPAEKRTCFCLIEAGNNMVDDHARISQKNLADLTSEPAITHYYRLSIYQAIADIMDNKFAGAFRRGFIQGKIIEISTTQLYDILNYDHDSSSPIDEKDAAHIIEAKEILRKNLKNPPTIKRLAKQVGINENKLKMGFKKMYNTTINNFLTEERLRTARLMLEERKFIVKEISSEVGYHNPSYFAKLFRKKFGVAPKIYLKLRK